MTAGVRGTIPTQEGSSKTLGKVSKALGEDTGWRGGEKTTILVIDGRAADADCRVGSGVRAGDDAPPGGPGDGRGGYHCTCWSKAYSGCGCAKASQSGTASTSGSSHAGGPRAEVGEDPLHRGGLGDASDDAHVGAAVGANQGQDCVDSGDQRGPERACEAGWSSVWTDSNGTLGTVEVDSASDVSSGNPA